MLPTLSLGGAASDSLDLESEPMFFDHSRCADCSYAYSITCDCTNHFSALQKQATDANQKLQALVEIREKMSEAYDQMNSEAMGAGNETSKNGSFSSVRDATLVNRGSPVPQNPGHSANDDSPQHLKICADEQTNVL